MSGDILNKCDIINDVKREGEIILGRPMTDNEIDKTCEYMLSDFTDYLYEQGYFEEDNDFGEDDIQAFKDYFDETFLDNLKETLPCVMEALNEERNEAEHKQNIIERFPKELKGFNRANDINGNAVLKAFYKDGTNELIRDGRVQDFYERYNVKFNDYHKSYKSVDTLRTSNIKSNINIER